MAGYPSNLAKKFSPTEQFPQHILPLLRLRNAQWWGYESLTAIVLVQILHQFRILLMQHYSYLATSEDALVSLPWFQMLTLRRGTWWWWCFTYNYSASVFTKATNILCCLLQSRRPAPLTSSCATTATVSRSAGSVMTTTTARTATTSRIVVSFLLDNAFKSSLYLIRVP